MSQADCARAGAPAGKGDFLDGRLHALDAYRGLIMVALAFTGFGLAATAERHLRAGAGDPGLWGAVRYQFGHVEWAGCAFWDLIQPSFMFMVGVAAAFSYARRGRGQSRARMFAHVLWRSLVLVFLGIFLISNWQRIGPQPTTNWLLVNVLTQIGLGYPLLFLLWGRSFRTQALAACGILVGTWLLYVLYPYSGIDLATGAPEVGVSQAWAREHLAGVGAAWHKNANVGHALDVWLLNLLPRAEPFRFSSGGYATLNFVPSLATMLSGLMCGELLRSGRAAGQKLLWLTAAGLGGLGLGMLLDWSGICPSVKRIWTPSWALFSTGWCCLILAGLYAVIDVLRQRWWAWPLTVVGVNSIAIYCMAMLLDPWTARTWQIHCGRDVFLAWGPLWEPTVKALLVGGTYWLACLWMYRQKIFVRI
jgi:predicted acyltransferase